MAIASPRSTKLPQPLPANIKGLFKGRPIQQNQKSLEICLKLFIRVEAVSLSAQCPRPVVAHDGGGSGDNLVGEWKMSIA